MRYIRFNDTVYLWNGNALSIDNGACVSRFCGAPGALNRTTIAGGIRDDSLCVFPRTVCGDSSATNYVAPANRRNGDIVDNSACTYPRPETYRVNLTLTGSSGTGWTRAGTGTGNFTSSNSPLGTPQSYSVDARGQLQPGFRWVTQPTVAFSGDPRSGPPQLTGTTITVVATFTGGVAEAVEDQPESAVFRYGVDQGSSCALDDDDVRTLYWAGGTDFGVGVSVFTNDALTTTANTGWYSFGLVSARVAGGVVRETDVACRFEEVVPPPATFTVPTITNLNPTAAGGVPIASQQTFTLTLNNPSNLEVDLTWTVSGNFWDLDRITGTNATVRYAGNTNAGVAQTFATVAAQLTYIHPTTGQTLRASGLSTTIFREGASTGGPTRGGFNPVNV